MKEVFILIQTTFPFDQEKMETMEEGQNNATIVIVEKGYNVNDVDSAKKFAAVMVAYEGMVEENENVDEDELTKNARKIYSSYNQQVIEAKISGEESYPTFFEGMIDSMDTVITLALENI